MQRCIRAGTLAVLLAISAPTGVFASEALPGANLPALLALAKTNNPDYASMRFEAQAAAERVEPAGALPDPKFRTEWMDVTKGGTQNATLWPSGVGSTRYTVMQDLPWFGKRDLKREVARLAAESSQGKAQGSWLALAAAIKTLQAQRAYLLGSAQLTQEILGLMARLEQLAQSRYAGGLATQQEVIRAQLEQTAMRSELVMIESEQRQVDARLNALLARPASAALAPPEAQAPLPAPAQLDAARLDQRVRASNPQLFVEEALIQAAEKSRDLTLRNRYPDFTLSVSPTQVQTAVKEWSLMLEVNIPLQQSSRRAMEREAEAMLAAARARKDAAANELLAALAQNLTAIDAARRTEALANHSLLPQTRLSFDAAMVSYENGKLDFAALLDAQRQIRQARQNLIKARLEGQVRLAEVEKILGEDL